MRGNYSGNNGLILVVAMVAVAVIATFILDTIAERLGLELSTLFWLVVSLLVLIAAWRYVCPALGFDPHDHWPIFAAVGWACLWPALDDWAAHPVMQSNVLAYVPFIDSTPVWWAAWSTKWIVLGVIVCVGYGIQWVFSRDNYYR